MNQSQLKQTEDATVTEDETGESLVPPASSQTTYNPLERLPLKWDPPQEEEF